MNIFYKLYPFLVKSLTIDLKIYLIISYQKSCNRWHYCEVIVLYHAVCIVSKILAKRNNFIYVSNYMHNTY